MALALIAALTACTNGDELMPNPPVPTTIEISPSSATLSYINESGGFGASVYDQNGRITFAPLSWSVSDTAILGLVADTVSDSLVGSGPEGRASTQWTLGEARRQTVTVSVDDFRQRFTATANAGPPVPDYALLDGLDFTRLDPLDTDTIEASATISNLGDGAGPERFRAQLTLDGAPLRILTVDRIAPGTAETLTFTMDPLEVGTRQVGLAVDAGDAIVEWDEENNSAAGTLRVVRQREIALGESVTLESSTVDEVFLFRLEVSPASPRG